MSSKKNKEKPAPGFFQSFSVVPKYLQCCFHFLLRWLISAAVARIQRQKKNPEISGGDQVRKSFLTQYILSTFFMNGSKSIQSGPENLKKSRPKKTREMK